MRLLINFWDQGIRSLPKALGAVRSMTTSRCNRAISLQRSTGDRAVSRIPNTDLDHQLKRHGKEKIIVIGLMANTCIEATARIGMELGYHVTLVRDATAARSREALQAAMDINGPSYAHEILTSQELIAAMRNSVPSRAAAV